MSTPHALGRAREHASAALEAFRLIQNMTRAAHLAGAVEQLLPLIGGPVVPIPRLDGSEAVTYVRPDGSAVLSLADLRTVLDALDVAADHKRDAADICGDCDGYPDGELCGSCEHRLRVADEYDALTERIRSGR